jgi:hypothetical protein
MDKYGLPNIDYRFTSEMVNKLGAEKVCNYFSVQLNKMTALLGPYLLFKHTQKKKKKAFGELQTEPLWGAKKAKSIE